MPKFIFILTILIMTWKWGICQKMPDKPDKNPPLLVPSSGAPPSMRAAQGPLQPPLPPAPPGPVFPQIPTLSEKELLANLSKALTTIQQLNKQLTAGRVWFTRSPTGEIEIKGGLLYQGVVVAVLHFHPKEGEPLPEGLNPHCWRTSLVLTTIQDRFSSMIGDLKILPAATFAEPEACWIFPVVFNNAIVTHIKIFYDGLHVVQDFAANQEMLFYGQ